MSFYTHFARGLRRAFQALRWRWHVDDVGPQEGPAIYVIHHQNMFGPIQTIGLLPVEAHMWSLVCFCSRETCFTQFYEYTFRTRYGWSVPVSYCIAKVLSYLVPFILRSFDVIPVHHGGGSLISLRKAMQALDKGENMAICPDIDYASSSPEIGEIYTGFFLLGRMYRERTGKALPFVPVYCSKHSRRLALGAPLYLDDTRPLDEDSKRAMAGALCEAINALGRACGDISP